MMKKEKSTSSSARKLVRCCDCCNATRDTEGRSFSIDTGEFFMGKCDWGHGDPFKVFMDKARECGHFNIPKPTELTKDQDENKE